jgi:catechol 2,3-dioxygenase-like lactoylglutathione lyase family enzyme
MFDHVTIRVSDRAASARFYDTVLAVVGLERKAGEEYLEWGDFSVSQAVGEEALTHRLHVAFAGASRAEVDEFWRAGTHAGYPDDGIPGPRPMYREDYYGAFLLDPDGNSVEAVHHSRIAPRGKIAHLWIGVAALEPARRFYELVAEVAGFSARYHDPPRAQFAGATASFTLVEREPTANVHVAFPAQSNEQVDRFHGHLTAAGYRDNGAPGERPEYHAGYYGAFVLDPDGNNLELVNHNRG